MWIRRLAIRFTSGLCELIIVLAALFAFAVGRTLEQSLGSGNDVIAVVLAVLIFFVMCVIASAFFCLVEIFENTRAAVDLLKQIREEKINPVKDFLDKASRS